MRTSIILLVFISLSLNTCRKNTTSFDRYTIKLQSESVGVTEAWLQLSVQPLTSEDRFVVKRDTHWVFRGRLSSQDTIISDLDLKPSTTYGYTAYREADGQQAGKATTLDITTMDTTSHDFEWEIYEFGADGGGSSVLYDVAIINENDIWAVGEIHTSDTDRWNEDSTKWIKPYNAVHWDGDEWELKRIPFIGGCSAVDYPPIKTVWAFSENKILFTNGGAIAEYNGHNTKLDCRMNTLLNGAIKKILSITPSNIYAVGG
ncbi:MAG: glucosyl transferase, partial [Caldithrix sp.]|nr:glucosyl transferase [Caldithrix sp.]